MAEYTEAQTKLKEEIEKRRFYTIDQSGETDTYIRAYIILKTVYDTGVNRFNRKGNEKKVRAQMKELDLADYASRPEEEQAVIFDQWVELGKKYIKLSIKDKSYSRTVFGLIPMKEDTVERKIKTDFDQISRQLPQCFGLENEFAPFFRALNKAYDEAVPKE